MCHVWLVVFLSHLSLHGEASLSSSSAVLRRSWMMCLKPSVRAFWSSESMFTTSFLLFMLYSLIPFKCALEPTSVKILHTFRMLKKNSGLLSKPVMIKYDKIHSPASLLGPPVHLLIHAVIQSANRVATVHCIKSCRYKSSASHQTSEWRNDLISVNWTVPL